MTCHQLDEGAGGAGGGGGGGGTGSQWNPGGEPSCASRLGGGEGGACTDAHTVNPSARTDESENHDMVSPAVICT